MTAIRMSEEDLPTLLPPGATEPRVEYRAVNLPTFAQMIAMFAALAAALGQRACLVLAGAATFALAWRVLSVPDPSTNALWGMTIFAVVVFGATVWLNRNHAS